MFNNVVLDVAIGLVFIYLLYSLLATIVQELIASKLAFRSKVLEKAIIRMLEDGKATSNNRKFFDRFSGFLHLFGKFNHLTDKKIAAWFYAHPLIKYLGEDNFYSKPAYLSAGNFSKVIIDMLKGFSSAGGNDVQQINDSINQGKIYQLPIDLNNDKKNPAIAAIRSQLKIGKDNYVVNPANKIEINADTSLFLRSLWKESNADVDVFKKKLEGWFDDTMERATGWYKRYVKFILFAVGIAMAVGFNIDSISITKKLMQDPKLREQMVQNANNFLEKNKQLGLQLQEMRNRKDTSPYYDTLAADYDKQRKRSDSLLRKADSLVNTDIKNVNQLMGLGWKADSSKMDSMKILGRWTLFHYSKCSHDKAYGFLCSVCNRQGKESFIGWLITAFAISLGAPFWFDLLNKLMKLRGTGGKGDASDNNSTAAKALSSANPSAPVSINVNTQSGEEAVG